MGNEMSTESSSEHLTQKEIERVRRRFARLAKSENPYCDPNAPSVTVAGLAEAVEGGPLAERVLGAFDQDADGTMSANEALEAMQLLSRGRTEEHRMWLMFRVYDGDRDGFVGSRDLLSVLREVDGGSVPDTQLIEMAAEMIAEHDLDRDGRLSYQEFVDMVQRCASLQLEGPPEKAALTQPMTPTPSLAGPGPGAPERGGTPRQYDGVRETGAVPGDRGGLRERRGVQAEHVVIPDSGGNGVEAERMEIERKEAERREAKRKEAERREIERREVERREAERREGQQTMSDRAEAHRQAEPASAPPPNHRPRPPSTPPSATSDARRPTHPSDTAAIASESPTLRPEQSLFGPDDDDDSDIDLPGLSVPSGGAHSAALSPGVGTDPFGGPDSPGVAINGSEDLGREASGLMVSHSQSWGAGGLRAEYSQPSLREQFGNG